MDEARFNIYFNDPDYGNIGRKYEDFTAVGAGTMVTHLLQMGCEITSVINQEDD